MRPCFHLDQRSADHLLPLRQYTNFTKQRDDLIERQSDLDSSEEAINELIENLDQRKDEAIERTFKQVAKYFEEVFEKLVPAGRGRLIMQKRDIAVSSILDFAVSRSLIVEQDDEMDVGEDGEATHSVENYTGVAIRVSFNSKSSEGLKIQQLSGGQKALVALAMSASCSFSGFSRC